MLLFLVSQIDLGFGDFCLIGGSSGVDPDEDLLGRCEGEALRSRGGSEANLDCDGKPGTWSDPKVWMDIAPFDH